MKKTILALMVLGLLFTGGGCCFLYGEGNRRYVEPPIIVAEITPRGMMDQLGEHFRGIVPRGITLREGRYIITTLQEYSRGIRELLYPGIDPYVALGRLREWCAHLAVGLMWDVTHQTHRLVVLAGPRFQFYFFSFETLQQIPRPEKIWYVIM